MRVLITGITGFAGSHLAGLALSKKGVRVFGLKRHSSGLDRLQDIARRIEFYECDLTDASAVAAAFRKIKPDRVFHLAGQSYTDGSWGTPVKTLNANILGALNVLEAVRTLSPRVRLLMVGSCEEYGKYPLKEMPLREQTPLKPLSPYGASKAAAGLLAYQYFRNFKIHVVRVRAFNHTGPRQKDLFVASNFARQISRIEAGLEAPVIRVGNLEAIRDFTDVRDVVRAYWLLLQMGKPGEVYNVCSGRGVKIRRLLDICLEKSKVKIRIQKDPKRLRPNEIPGWIGDPSKIKKETGWKPSIPLETTLSDLLNVWRK